MVDKIEFIQSYIDRIDESLYSSTEQMIELIEEITSVFVGDIENINLGITSGNDFFICNQELKILKGKLQSYQSSLISEKEKMQLELKIKQAQVNINTYNQNINNNSIEIEISFEQVKENIKNNDSLTDEEVEEIIQRINEIEIISKSQDRKPTKWQNIKPILTWLGDKTVDVGIALLPLIIQSLQTV